jgi:hypothetical protein
MNIQFWGLLGAFLFGIGCWILAIHAFIELFKGL